MTAIVVEVFVEIMDISTMATLFYVHIIVGGGGGGAVVVRDHGFFVCYLSNSRTRMRG